MPQDTSWISSGIFAVLFTGGGVVLLVVGIRRSMARARWQREDDQRLLHPSQSPTRDEDRPPAPSPGGGWLTAAGAVMLLLGLGVMSRDVVPFGIGEPV